jgi:orotidine-5'-phosphate decarboxylase
MSQSSSVIVALDFPSERETMQLVDQLEPALCRLKVGKELFTRCGPALVKQLVDKRFDVFLDLKYHDIPNTVAQACVAAADLGVWMLNVHALGGERMMQAAKQALVNHQTPSQPSPLLIAVTWLTSSGQAELDALGIKATPQEMVTRLARMTKNAGLDGVVCSAQEAPILRHNMGNDFLLVTPGIRLADSQQDDQCRVVTPEKAIADGASYLVIGRPITQSKDPCKVLRTIISDIS